MRERKARLAWLRAPRQTTHECKREENAETKGGAKTKTSCLHAPRAKPPREAGTKGNTEMSNQSLGNGSVDAVHAHVIAMVGTPAQRQFAEIAGADDNSTGLIGNIHEDLGPLPRLTVLKRDGMIFHIMADIPEMTPDAVGNIDGSKRCAHLFGKNDGVVFGPVGRTKTGHRDSDNICGRPVQHLHSQAGD